MMRTDPISIPQSPIVFEINPIPSPRIDNFDAHLINNGSFDTAAALSNMLWHEHENGASSECIVELVLRQHNSIIKWIADKSYSAFYNAIASRAPMKPISKILNQTLNWIYLGAQVQRGEFTPFAVFYLFDRALQSEACKEDRILVDELFDRYPKLPIYLRSQSLSELQKEIDKFCFSVTRGERNSSEINILLETAYFAVLESSPLFALASHFERTSKGHLEASLARAEPSHWEQFSFTDLHQGNLKPEQAWKHLFHEFRKAAYFQTFSPEMKRALISNLNLLSKDISYFDRRHPEGQQLEFLIREAKNSNGNEYMFPRCNEHLNELQQKLELCRNHFQPQKLLKIFTGQEKDFFQILQMNKQFSSSFDSKVFMDIFDEPIYQASATYLFQALIFSDRRFWPFRLCEAWRQSLNNNSIDQNSIYSLGFKDYERMIYEVWDLISAEFPKCRDMDLPDLLKRKIEALDSDSLCRLYEAMNKVSHQNRHNILLSFFSDNGNLRDLKWLLEDLLS